MMPRAATCHRPPICAATWRARVMEALGEVRLTLVVGGYAQNGIATQARCNRDGARLARPCARSLPLATSVMAQYGMAEEKSVVRGRASARSAPEAQRGVAMSEQTPLDRAHAAMEAMPQDDAARLRFFERLADVELFLL